MFRVSPILSSATKCNPHPENSKPIAAYLLGAASMIELAQAQDGRLILGVNEPLPADIEFVEFYADLRLFSLSYENGESALMPLEIPAEIAPLVRGAAQLIVLEMMGNSQEPLGYSVPLIQVGL